VCLQEAEVTGTERKRTWRARNPERRRAHERTRARARHHGVNWVEVTIYVLDAAPILRRLEKRGEVIISEDGTVRLTRFAEGAAA
jgi:hypothetical protein